MPQEHPLLPAILVPLQIIKQKKEDLYILKASAEFISSLVFLAKI